MLKFVFQTGLERLFEERDFVGTLVDDRLDDVFYHFGCNLDDVGKFCKSHFRLDLPKFRSVTRSVAVFRSERRAERVNLAHRHSGNLAFELSADGKSRFSAEEIVCDIFRLVLCKFCVLIILRRNSEYLTRALAVAARDNWSVHVGVTVFLEETMDCKAELGADAEHCVHGVGSGTQMRNGAQKLHRVIFL